LIAASCLTLQTEPLLRLLLPATSLQVVTISSAASAAYSSMLQHMAAVPLLGLDTESSWLGSDGSVTVVLSFMAPGVPASGAGMVMGSAVH
jgi:hypothetical protein